VESFPSYKEFEDSITWGGGKKGTGRRKSRWLLRLSRKGGYFFSTKKKEKKERDKDTAVFLPWRKDRGKSCPFP